MPALFANFRRNTSDRFSKFFRPGRRETHLNKISSEAKILLALLTPSTNAAPALSLQEQLTVLDKMRNCIYNINLVIQEFQLEEGYNDGMKHELEHNLNQALYAFVNLLQEARYPLPSPLPQDREEFLVWIDKSFNQFYKSVTDHLKKYDQALTFINKNSVPTRNIIDPVLTQARTLVAEARSKLANTKVSLKTVKNGKSVEENVTIEAACHKMPWKELKQNEFYKLHIDYLRARTNTARANYTALQKIAKTLAPNSLIHALFGQRAESSDYQAALELQLAAFDIFQDAVEAYDKAMLQEQYMCWSDTAYTLKTSMTLIEATLNRGFSTRVREFFSGNKIDEAKLKKKHEGYVSQLQKLNEQVASLKDIAVDATKTVYKEATQPVGFFKWFAGLNAELTSFVTNTLPRAQTAAVRRATNARRPAPAVPTGVDAEATSTATIAVENSLVTAPLQLRDLREQMSSRLKQGNIEQLKQWVTALVDKIKFKPEQSAEEFGWVATLTNGFTADNDHENLLTQLQDDKPLSIRVTLQAPHQFSNELFQSYLNSTGKKGTPDTALKWIQSFIADKKYLPDEHKTVDQVKRDKALLVVQILHIILHGTSEQREQLDMDLATLDFTINGFPGMSGFASESEEIILAEGMREILDQLLGKTETLDDLMMIPYMPPPPPLAAAPVGDGAIRFSSMPLPASVVPEPRRIAPARPILFIPRPPAFPPPQSSAFAFPPIDARPTFAPVGSTAVTNLPPPMATAVNATRPRTTSIPPLSLVTAATALAEPASSNPVAAQLPAPLAIAAPTTPVSTPRSLAAAEFTFTAPSAPVITGPQGGPPPPPPPPPPVFSGSVVAASTTPTKPAQAGAPLDMASALAAGVTLKKAVTREAGTPAAAAAANANQSATPAKATIPTPGRPLGRPGTGSPASNLGGELAERLAKLKKSKTNEGTPPAAAAPSTSPTAS